MGTGGPGWERPLEPHRSWAGPSPVNRGLTGQSALPPPTSYPAGMESESARSPFYDPAAALGATFMEEGGWYWTEGFGDLDAEYAGVRDDLGVWDVSPLNKWEFRGPDAVAAAQRVHSNNIQGLAVGQVRYGGFLDVGGLMVDDGTVYKVADDLVWVMTNGSDRVDYFADATAGLDVDITPVTLSMPHLGLQGPRARDAVGPALWRRHHRSRVLPAPSEPTTVGGVPCVVSRTGFGGELGFELFCRPEDAVDLWDVVVNRMRAVPFGVELIEVLRVEAGLIVLDYDYEAHQVTPFDLFARQDGRPRHRGLPGGGQSGRRWPPTRRGA